MSYWDAYDLPVPIRHYWIQRYNKQNNKKSEDVDKPLTAMQKAKYKQKSQQVAGQQRLPMDLSKMMTPRRNQK